MPVSCASWSITTTQISPSVDLHKQGSRQGPGGDAETEQALNLAMVDRTAPLKVADIGCGTGASAVLARLLNAHIKAVDLFQDFLDVLKERAESSGVSDRISAHACSMEHLPFAAEEFDIIWPEGAIENS
jgi:ubiquinone/menaquinone biosynthesis C-methylase UbiE